MSKYIRIKRMELQSGKKRPRSGSDSDSAMDSGSVSGLDLEQRYSTAFDMICGYWKVKHHDYQLFCDNVMRINAGTPISLEMNFEIESTLCDMLHSLGELLNYHVARCGPASLESLARKQVIGGLGYSYMCILEHRFDDEKELQYAYLIKDVIIDCMRVFYYMFGVKRLDSANNFVTRNNLWGIAGVLGEELQMGSQFILNFSDDIMDNVLADGHGEVRNTCTFLQGLLSFLDSRRHDDLYINYITGKLHTEHPMLERPFFDYYNGLRMRGTPLRIEDIERFFMGIVGPYLASMGPAYARLANLCMIRGKFLRYAKYGAIFCEICNQAEHGRNYEIQYFFHCRELYETGRLWQMFGRH